METPLRQNRTSVTTYPAFPSAVPPLDIEVGKYRLRFARTMEDLETIFRLRFEVFNLELGEGMDEAYKTRMDRDEFDESCHHLMVIEKGTGQTIGTYRMQTESMAAAGHGFYSSQEYDLSAVPADLRKQSVELGRACIHRDFRNGRVLFLLWKGLILYLQHNRKRYFFGCCSLTSQEAREGWDVFSHLQRIKAFHPDFLVKAQPQYTLANRPSFDSCAHMSLPKLMQLYLNYGAVICSEPAIDRIFKTIDYLAFFDLESISERTRKLFIDR